MSRHARSARRGLRSTGALAVLLAGVLVSMPTPGEAQNGREPLFDPDADPTADLEAAIVEAAATGRRIILDVGGNWCGWCYLLSRQPLTRAR